jgi:MYXO-CTERM domain-containing protein
MSCIPRSVLVALALGASLLVTRRAFAESDCPPGSTAKSEGGFTWCEASVCLNDGSCRPDEVCRTVPLCVQVGKVETGGPAVTKDGGTPRLVATGRCGPNKTCADSTTVCLEGGRCLARTVADKMGLLTPVAAPAASAPPEAKPAGKSCGCRAAGTDGATGSSAGVVTALGLALLASARRARR